MSKIQQVNGPPLTDLQKRLCIENIRRLKAFAETPLEERPEPTPRPLTCDHKPVPFAISLLDLTHTVPPENGTGDQHAIPRNKQRFSRC